jgi:hypothetical protein
LILAPTLERIMRLAIVKTEIANAREREDREKKQTLFPITLAPFAAVRRWKLFDADRGIELARYASISSPTSATGRTTIRIRGLFSGWRRT